MDTLIAPTQQPGAVSLTGATRIPGPIDPFGSGEAAPLARRVHAAALGGINQPIRACMLETPAGFEQSQADRVVRPHDTRVLGERLRGPVQLRELAAGHLLLDPTTPAGEHVRDLSLSFIQG